MAKTLKAKATKKASSPAKKAAKVISKKKTSSRPSSKKSAPASPAKPKKSPVKYVNSYDKVIRMFKSQADYFQLNQKYKHCGLATRVIHAGNEPSQEFHGVSPPIDLSTTYAQEAPGVPAVFDYARCGNPTRACLERVLASMEHANYSFATSSGMAAHVTLTNILQKGDHILCVDDVYGGTQRYLRRILNPNAEIEVDFVCFNDTAEFKKAFKKNTKIVWLETPTNPTLKCFDISAVAKMIKGSGAILVVDNTFFTPVICNPLLQGADVVVHSMSKYLGGHSDVISGCICLNSKELYDRLFFVLKTMGTGLSAFDSWLVLRGAKTLTVRVERASSNAMKIAKLLEGHPKCQKVIYPGLKSHPQHSIVARTTTGKGYGGMLSFYIKGGIKGAERFLKALKVFTLAESLGGVESLAENPALMTHGSVPAAHRAKLGIEDNFIRLSTGIEAEEDLLADISQALAKA